MKKIVTFLFLAFTISVYSQQFNGNYKYEGENATLKLKLQQSNTKLTGTLSSSTGTVFEIQGEVENNVAVGICGNADGKSFFEAYIEGDVLSFGLIESDANNMPNYETAQYIVFSKTTNSSSLQTKKPKTNIQVPTEEPQSNTKLKYNLGSSSINSNEVGDLSWGFKLAPPRGWVHQKSAEYIILGHNTIAGMIIIFPHQSKTLQLMQAEMNEGIHEESNDLNIKQGTLKSAGNQIISANYTGFMDGTQVKGTGFGLLSPYGGGAYVLAISTPEAFGNELVKAAEQSVKNLSFFKPEVDLELVKLFAGKWTTMTKNTTTSFCLCEDGSFNENSESSYSGNDANSVGGVWGTANNSQSSGRWTIKGDKMEGQFIITFQNGNTAIYNYVRNGNKLNELYINNTLYGRYDDM
jgi:hypothetical protein